MRTSPSITHTETVPAYFSHNTPACCHSSWYYNYWSNFVMCMSAHQGITCFQFAVNNPLRLNAGVGRSNSKCLELLTAVKHVVITNYNNQGKEQEFYQFWLMSLVMHVTCNMCRTDVRVSLVLVTVLWNFIKTILIENCWIHCIDDAGFIHDSSCCLSRTNN